MKKSLPLVFFIFALFSTAQQSSNPNLNKNYYSYDFLQPNKPQYSLNLDFLKLEKLKQNDQLSSELRRGPTSEMPRPIDNMPIFKSTGKFYLKIVPIDEDIDYKLNIFTLEKSG